MKKAIITSLLFVPAALYAMPAQQADTLVNISNASSVTVTESPSEMNVWIQRAEESDTITDVFSVKLENATVRQRQWANPLKAITGGSSKWDVVLSGPSVGWVNAVGQPAGLGIEMGKSMEISWLNMLAVVYKLKHSELSVGFGFDWRNYRISTGVHRFAGTPEGGVCVEPYPEGSTPHGSRLKVFSMGIPVLWRQILPFNTLDGHRFSITAGVVLNYNSHGSMLAKWTTADGRDAEYRTNHIGQRRFTIDFLGIIHLGWGINAYVRYSPNTVLRGTGQPRFRPLSTGLLFAF
ncbi:MAG: hypothetical protein NC189_01610 [Bacteroides sp.]|nr:hypothetical protein [Bacteroides sp.]